MAMDKSRASSQSVEFEIVHAVRGRVRLRLRGKLTRELLQQIVGHLHRQAGILTVQIKQKTNSLVVTYAPDVISLEQLTDYLQSWGEAVTGTQVVTLTLEKSPNLAYSRLFSLVPPLVGLAVARGLQVSGWKSILTYILTAGITREAIDSVRGESEPEESSPAQKVPTTEEIVTKEISSLLTAINSDYQIVHHVPGRIRLRIPEIKRDRHYAYQLKSLLERDDRITEVRLKTNSSSVVILYEREAISNLKGESLDLNNRDLNNSNSEVEKPKSSTHSDPKQPPRESDLNSDLNDVPPSGDESASESVSLTSKPDTDTSDLVEEAAEATTPITNDESETETPQEFAKPETTDHAGYWSNFKSSMMLTMLQLMGGMPVHTAKI